MSIHCQDKISTYEVKLCRQHKMKHCFLFSDYLSHAILISLFPGIDTHILHKGLKHFLKQLFDY